MMLPHTKYTYWFLACLSLTWLGCRSPDQGAGKIGAIKKWGVFAGDRVQSKPAVAPDGTVYVGSADKHLYAFSSKGHLEWRYKTEDKVLSPTVLPDGSIAFTTLDGFFFRLAHDGRLIWKKRVRDKIFGCAPVLASNNVLFTTGDLVLIGHKMKDGSFFKLADKLPPISTCITLNPKRDVLYFGSKHTLYAWGLDGKKRWSVRIGSLFSRPGIDQQGNLYVGAGGKGTGFVLALDAKGKERWRYQPATIDIKYIPEQYKQIWGLFSRPVISPKGHIIAVRMGEGLLALSADGKKKLWSFAQNDRYAFSGHFSVAKNGMIYAGAMDNHLYAITPKGKLHYKFMTYGRIFYAGAFSQDQSTLYIGSEDKHFYAFRTKKK